VISGYVGLQDANASEETFQDLVDDIVNALESRKRLGLGTSAPIHVRPPQVPVIDHAWFGPLLCHHCDIQLRVLERRTIAYTA